VTEANAHTQGDVALPRPPGVFRRWLAAHPRVVDWTIVGVYLFVCMVTTIAGGLVVVTGNYAADLASGAFYLGWPGVVVTVVLVGVVALALVQRRRYPIAGLIAVALVLWFANMLWFAPQNLVALIVMLYSVPVYRSVRAAWAAYGIAAGLNFVAAVIAGGFAGSGLLFFHFSAASSLREALGEAVTVAVMLLIPVMVGINIGNRKRYLDALIERAYQLAREREQQAQLAAAAERSRIAREMHDIVAHSLSVAVTLSEAASVAIATQPAAAKQAMDRAADTGRAALAEMRRLLGVLNEDQGTVTSTAPLAPQPGIAQLGELIAGFSDAGLHLTLTEQGVPSGDAAQQLAVYRIVQESLTNSLRYAGRGAQVRVTVTHTPQETRLEIVDSAATEERSAASVVPGSGRGIAGARQRAELFGGQLAAGPYATGWKLTATVPTAPQVEREEGSDDR